MFIPRRFMQRTGAPVAKVSADICRCTIQARKSPFVDWIGGRTGPGLVKRVEREVHRVNTAVRERRFVGFVVALAAMLAVFAVNTERSQATSVGNPVIYQVTQDGQSQNTLRVGQYYGLMIEFNATSGLQNNDLIYMDLPPTASWINAGAQFGYLSAGYSMGTAPFSEGNRRQQVRVMNLSSPVPAGAEVEVWYQAAGVAFYSGTQLGAQNLSLWTNRDTDPATIGYTLVAGLPSALEVTDGEGAETTVDTSFDSTIAVKVTDSVGNPIEGEDVTFTIEAPEEGAPSGAFLVDDEEESSFTGESGANGIVEAPTVVANTKAGEWSISVAGPNEASAEISLTNLPGAITGLAILPDHEFNLPADGVSSTTFRVRAGDDFGNGVSNAANLITLTAADPTSQVGPVTDTDGEPGVYEAVITAGYTPGLNLISVSLPAELAVPAVQTNINQLEMPAPLVKISTKPKAKIKSKKKSVNVRYAFSSDSIVVSRFECKVDKKPWKTCSAPLSFKAKSGRHTVRVRAVPMWGEPGPVKSHKFKVIRLKKK